jgi:hypothetical protein
MGYKNRNFNAGRPSIKKRVNCISQNAEIPH